MFTQFSFHTSPKTVRSCKFQRTLSNTEIDRNDFWRPWDEDDEQFDIDQSFVYTLCANDNEEYNLNDFYDMVQQYEIFENSTYHCENPSKIPFNKLDPSLAIGFYCATLLDLNNLCEFVKKVFII